MAQGIFIGENGRFDIGSESCSFTKKAIITLTGLATDPTLKLNFGNKFLGVGAKGTLEMHGATRLPAWTQLAASASSDVYRTDSGSRGLTLGRRQHII